MIDSYDVNYNRKFRIFISSTFKDMDTERDVIVNSVFPRLRARFRKSLIEISEVDLRWGIPNEDEFQILEICLGEIVTSVFTIST